MVDVIQTIGHQVEWNWSVEAATFFISK